MHTFVFVVSPVADEAERLCRRALERLSGNLPSLGSPAAIVSHALPELSAAYATLLPSVDRAIPLLQTQLSERHVSISYGERRNTPRLAALVRDVFEREGAEGVAALDGNFSALVVDRVARSVWLCGTLLGHHSLLHGQAGPSFVASPHDLTLVASGVLPLQPDLVSLASMIACDWSLEGRPLLASARRCHPLEIVRFRAGRTDTLAVSRALSDGRLQARDRAGVARQIEGIADHLEESASAATAGLERIEAALTAGIDSRALWATLVRAGSGRPMVAFTTGAARSLDVRVARRLARGMGAEHVRRDVEAPTASDFGQVLELMAFFAGGDTSAKRALTRVPRLQERQPFAGGTGGEIFRGFFYPYLGAGNAGLGAKELADRLLRWRFRRYERLEFRNSELRGELRERLLSALERCRVGANSAHDVLDSFYLFERYGRWGARPACFPWNAAWTPFESVSAIREAMRLPSPRGNACSVHELLIRRHLPRQAYWTPINAGPLVALQGPGRVRQWLRQGFALRGLLQQKLERKLQRSSATGDDLRAGIFAKELSPVVRDLVAGDGSLSNELFGGVAVERLLSEHESRRNQLPVLGNLLCAEQWWRLARRLQA